MKKVADIGEGVNDDKVKELVKETVENLGGGLELAADTAS